jgi:hypothetical protein
MASTKPLPATDSASVLRELTGDDATATFESDPKFVDSNPGADGSSENVEEQRDTDDLEDSDEEEEDAEDEDEDDDEELEDDEEEVAASGMRLDGLLGQEDEYDDVRNKRDRAEGDAERAKESGEVQEPVEDQDEGDLDQGVDEDALDEDDMDTDKVAALSYMPGLPGGGAMEHAAAGI